MTPELLCAATGARIDRARLHAAALTAAMAEFTIDSPKRQAAFLARVGHETLSFIYTSEIWGPTAAQQGYEGRQDLGNTQPGDGRRFCGRGDLMITGRYNYKIYGDLLGVDLIAYPERAAEPEIGARIAGLYWTKNHCNGYADVDDFDGVCDVINRGRKTAPIGDSNGWADSVARWKVAKLALRVA